MACVESHIDECMCVERKCFVMNQCIPSPWCRNTSARSDAPADTHIVIPVVCNTPHACNHQKIIVRRLLLSLWAVHTALPVHIMTPNSTQFQELDAPLLHRNFTSTSTWTAPYHRYSFYKLHALQLVQFAKTIVLDTDVQVVRNIDHLASTPTPAFVVHRPDKGINSGLQVIRPELRRFDAAIQLIRGQKNKRHDGGDQEVLRRLFPTFYELPLKYNARPHFSPVRNHMCDAFVLHNFDGRKHENTVARTLYIDECTRTR